MSDSLTAAPITVFTDPAVIAKAAGKPFDLRFGMTVEKVDKEKRTVRGRATAEVLDAHGEVMDYETAKAAMQSWKGNLREMHQPIAAGRAVDIEFVDATKEIFVTSYVSKGAPQTWEKVLDGTLSEYSVGGRAVAKTEKVNGETVRKLYLTKMTELSLVDAGACPGSSFEIVKMDGEQPVMAQELTAEDAPAADNAGADATEATTDAAGAAAEADVEKPATDPADGTEAEAAKVVKVVAGTRADLLTLLSVPTAERIQRLDALLAQGIEADVQKRMESYDIRTALTAISSLQDLVASEYWDAKYLEESGKAADPEGPAQMEMLRNAAELVLAYLISEFMAQFDDAATSPSPTVVDGAKALGARAADVVANQVSLLKAIGLTLRTGAPAPVPTGGASAQSDAPSPSTPAATPAASSDPESITKLESLVSETTKALTQAQDTIRAQAESLSALQTRLEKIEAQPMPGGPVTRVVPGVAVHKQIGGDAGPLDGADTSEVIKALTDLASDPECSPAERTRIAQKLITLQMQAGAVINRPGA
jgi:hypothetical protein